MSVEQTHMARITVRVVDESGHPITNAPVRTSTVDGYRKGSAMWGYETNYREISFLTDNNGVAVLTVPNAESSLSYGVRDFPGYYWGGGWYEFKKTAMGPWQPWNPKVELELKRVGLQVPMYARKVGNQMGGEKIPVTGKPIGFDLMIGDWLPPYGKGETPDVIFQFDSTITKRITNSAPTYNGGMRTWTKEYFDNQLRIKFSNEGDGIQFVAAMGGELRLPRIAPTEGYQSVLTKREWNELGTNQLNRPYPESHTDYQKDSNYFFRVRTKKDASGKIVSALYGKIYGDFGENLEHGMIRFTYYLNPEPNSQNMEFNTKSNLFKNLSSLEGVFAP
jgi:hypothetical protein